jgi:serine/threonine-protein kinase
MLSPGADLGSYRVISLLGEGGMGLVYLAEHKALERRVAVKVLRPECGRDPSTVARFFTEAKAVNRIGHEHIVDVTDLGVTPDGETYIVMEYLVGESLDTRLKRDGAWEIERAVHLAIQVADALAASHEVGIIHRDLKPENIYLIQRSGERDYVKVLDFGLAKLIGDAMQDGQAAKTQAGTVIGTPQYMAPEQAFGKPVDARADVYSLGVILYQLVTGRLPFQADNAMGMLLQHATKPPPSMREVMPEIPEALDAIVKKAMAKSKEQRHADMAEMRDLLIQLQGQPYDIAATTQMAAITDDQEQAIADALLQGASLDSAVMMATGQALAGRSELATVIVNNNDQEEATRVEKPPPSEEPTAPDSAMVPPGLSVATSSGVRTQVSAASRTWAAGSSKTPSSGAPPPRAASTATPPRTESRRWINPPPTNPTAEPPPVQLPPPGRVLPPPAVIARPHHDSSSRWLAVLGALVLTLVIVLVVSQLSRGAPEVQPGSHPLPGPRVVPAPTAPPAPAVPPRRAVVAPRPAVRGPVAPAPSAPSVVPAPAPPAPAPPASPGTQPPMPR